MFFFFFIFLLTLRRTSRLAAMETIWNEKSVSRMRHHCLLLPRLTRAVYEVHPLSALVLARTAHRCDPSRFRVTNGSVA
jgi:hypothetical protein